MKKSLLKNGNHTSAKVQVIVSDGIVLDISGNTYFLSYTANPWFKNAKVSDVFDVEPISDVGVRWKNLDVDLAIDSFINPQKYPLIAK
jgi:ribosomal protein S1